MLEAFFKMRDCVGIPVVQQQRTTEIQRREREAPLIIQFAERIGRLGEQVLPSVRVPDGLNHTEWHQRRCLVPDVTERGIELDCGFQGGRGSFVIALPEGEHPEPEIRMRTLAALSAVSSTSACCTTS